MRMDQKTYQQYAKGRARKSPVLKNCLMAFLVGGLICSLGETLYRCYSMLGMTEKNTKTLVPMTLIFLAAVFTGIGVFDKLAKHAGAGTLVPITGFANAVVSPAIDSRAEGMVLGVGAKMFVVAGPVIVYGTLASVVWGVIYYFLYRGGVVS